MEALRNKSNHKYVYNINTSKVSGINDHEYIYGNVYGGTINCTNTVITGNAINVNVSADSYHTPVINGDVYGGVFNGTEINGKIYDGYFNTYLDGSYEILGGYFDYCRSDRLKLGTDAYIYGSVEYNDKYYFAVCTGSGS